MNLYEGMFLFDTGRVPEWSAVETELKRLFDRIGASQRVAIKFDERKLAFEIKKRKRGLFVLVYFDADPEKISELERDVRLSEVLLRVLVLRATAVTDARIEELKALPADQPIAPPPAERRYGDRRFGGGRDSRRERGPRRDRDAPRRDDARRAAPDESKTAPVVESASAPKPTESKTASVAESATAPEPAESKTASVAESATAPEPAGDTASD